MTAISIEELEKYSIGMRLAESAEAGDTVITMRAPIELITGETTEFRLNPGAATEETVTVSSVENKEATISSGLTYAHAAGELVTRGIQQSMLASDILLYVNVLHHGAAGDGTTDDASAIQTAIDYLEDQAIPGVVYLPGGKTYRIDSGLTVDVFYTSLMSNGAVIDASNMTSGNAISVTSSGASSAHYNQSRQKIEGLRITGGGESSNTVGISYAGGTGKVAHIGLYSCVIDNFQWGEKYGDSSYLIHHYNVDMHDCGICIYAPSGTDIGENIAYFGGVFFNSPVVIDCDDGTIDLRFISCSFDYNDQIIDISGGMAIFVSCHFESDKDTNYWFDISNDNVFVRIDSCLLTITDDKATYEVGRINSTVTERGLEINGLAVNIAPTTTYTPPELFTGGGRVSAQQISTLESATTVVVSDSLNLIGDSGFETDVGEWTQAGDDNSTQSASEQHGGSYSMEFTPSTNGNTVLCYIEAPCVPGQFSFCSFWLKASGLTAGSKTFVCTGTFRGRDGTVLKTGISTTISADVGSWTEYTTTMKAAPKGTTTFRLQFQLPTSLTTCFAYIDDVIINLV